MDEQNGMRRLSVARRDTGWVIEQRWQSRGVKPYFNDSVIHDGFVYGFEGRGIACMDIRDGARCWKGGKYGADQDLLLVVSEKGNLALVEARSDRWSELASIQAIQGKTWNHPVLVGNVLLVRNAAEMVAYRLKEI